MAPRQQLTPTPYALYAPNAGNAATATAAANIPGTFSGNGAGVTNLNGANLAAGSVGTAQLVGGTLAAPAGAGGTNINAKANTSYVLTNASATTLLMPVDANVGDVVQITGEGTGGWTAAYSPSAWTLTSAPSANWWSVASSSDGSHLAGVVTHYKQEIPFTAA